MNAADEPPPPPLTPRIERALRLAAVAHSGQFRKLSRPADGDQGQVPEVPVPYFQHLAAVALVLGRLGFGEDVLIAGVLHDAVEDAGVSLEQIREEFGSDVAAWVDDCTEVKVDPSTGGPRPWEVRKADHLAHLEHAPVEACAVALADKYHNLLSMLSDRAAGVDVWSKFNAPRERVLWYYGTMLENLGRGDDRLESLSRSCRDLLDQLR